MEKLIWKNEKRKLGELKSFPGNPRKSDEKQEADLDKSLDRFSLADPFIINTDNVIVGGNFRHRRMLKKYGKEQIVDVRVPSRKLTGEEAKELNLRLNKNQGSWDNDLLAKFGEDLLKYVGFGGEELLEMFGLGRAENIEVDLERLRVITIEPPESPKLKERMAFYCETMGEYNKILECFKKGRSELDKNKLLGMI